MGRKNVQKGRYKDQLIKDKYVVKLLVYFQKNGICKFSMSELANDFQISKTTLYNHFESKEEMVERALDYKLGVIGEYESVLENITLSYTERYRKSMLFFCVQSFDVSSVLLKEIKSEYPILWIRVQDFQKNVFDNLKSYYRIGIEIGIFSKDANPFLLSLSDQQFFELLSQKNIIDKIELDIISVFNHHYKMRFNGILN
jgi:AcrR family transcriptional regulator